MLLAQDSRGSEPETTSAGRLGHIRVSSVSASPTIVDSCCLLPKLTCVDTGVGPCFAQGTVEPASPKP